ncbi:MAG: aspartyl protease family protein [Chloroflexi bacterium]|nr:aspartyl protease family protein [Chloroflexota bacterium]
MLFIEIRTCCRLILPVIIVAYLCLLTVPVSAGKIYKWRDKQGRLHFSDSKHNVPTELLNETKEYQPDSSSITVMPGSEPISDNVAKTTDRDKLRKDSFSIPYVSREGSANRVIINVTFNGTVTAPILVDTGSPGLIISDDLAHRLGLFDKNGSRLMVLISGIGGTKTAARTIINKLSIGSITEEFIPAHIVSEKWDAYAGLIGMDILSSYTLTIDPANQRLIANEIPAVRNRPAGRDKVWWQAKFREFRFYSEFWEQQVMLVDRSNSPYSRLPPSEHKKLKSFIFQQRDEAQELFSKLERFARWRNVPRHWRR